MITQIVIIHYWKEKQKLLITFTCTMRQKDESVNVDCFAVDCPNTSSSS